MWVCRLIYSSVGLVRPVGAPVDHVSGGVFSTTAVGWRGARGKGAGINVGTWGGGMGVAGSATGTPGSVGGASIVEPPLVHKPASMVSRNRCAQMAPDMTAGTSAWLYKAKITYCGTIASGRAWSGAGHGTYQEHCATARECNIGETKRIGEEIHEEHGREGHPAGPR